jgi:exosortase
MLAASCIVPALLCCVFMPYHEEIMLLLSFPLRLTATVLSSIMLNLCGIKVIHSGTSLTLPGIDIAITDACSGINQLDAFILIAFVTVQLLHRKNSWKYLHFAFIMPSIILGNSLRIVLTVVLYRFMGERVFENTWHTGLGYGQIVLALLIFLAVGKVFSLADKKSGETES